jgi:hypothetical protein
MVLSAWCRARIGDSADDDSVNDEWWGPESWVPISSKQQFITTQTQKYNVFDN